MWHQISFIGRLSKDVDTRFTPAGEQVASFSMAVNDGYGDKKKTIWVNVSVWKKQAELCTEYLVKGSKVMIVGKLNPGEGGNPRTFKRNDGSYGASYDVTASSVTFLDSKGDAGDGDSEVVPF